MQQTFSKYIDIILISVNFKNYHRLYTSSKGFTKKLNFWEEIRRFIHIYLCLLVHFSDVNRDYTNLLGMG